MSDALLDPERAHDVAADVEAEDLARALGGLVGRRRQLDAAGLAAAADEHLRLDDDGPADLGRRRPRLLGRERDAPVRDGDAEAREELLALVLVEIHASEASRSRPR